jgi:hypothetical protein
MIFLHGGRIIGILPGSCASFTPDAIAGLPSIPGWVDALVADEHFPIRRLLHIRQSGHVHIPSVDLESIGVAVT